MNRSSVRLGTLNSGRGISGAGTNNISIGSYPSGAVLRAKVQILCRNSWALLLSSKASPSQNFIAKLSRLLLISRSWLQSKCLRMLQQICIFSISMHFFWNAMNPLAVMAFDCYYQHSFWIMFFIARISQPLSSVWKTRYWRPDRSLSLREPVSSVSRIRKIRNNAFLNLGVMVLWLRSQRGERGQRTALCAEFSTFFIFLSQRAEHSMPICTCLQLRTSPLRTSLTPTYSCS